MQDIDFSQLLIKYRFLILIGGVGALLILAGFLVYKNQGMIPSTKVEVLSESTSSATPKTITVEITGAVVKKGVYKIPDGSRVDDLILAAGGLTGAEDTNFTDKYLNRAARLLDGQKVFIPGINNQTGSKSANSSGVDQSVSSQNIPDSNGLININSASLTELDRLPGIGPVFGQSIIDHRPYSTGEELVNRGAIKQNIYLKIKDKISVY